MLKVGLLINPIAGIGGEAAQKGSDTAQIQALARARGGRPRGSDRAARALRALGARSTLAWYTWDGEMGASVFQACGMKARIVGVPGQPSSVADTRKAAAALADAAVDLLVFAGGDGTARDVLDAVGTRLPVLGIPAGVKMHSGVFATTPEVAAEILARLSMGGRVRAMRAEVRDRLEAVDLAQTSYFGDLLVPDIGGFVQHTKEGGRESERLALVEIVAQAVELIEGSALPCVLGPGGTLAEVKSALGISPTLLGVDVVRKGQPPALDVDADWLRREIAGHAELFVSFTRAQGFLLGRGNQQLSAEFLGRLERECVHVLSTRTKLLSLEGRPLLVDTDDAQLDQALSGLIEVVVGYEDRLLYHVATHA